MTIFIAKVKKNILTTLPLLRIQKRIFLHEENCYRRPYKWLHKYLEAPTQYSKARILCFEFVKMK